MFRICLYGFLFCVAMSLFELYRGRTMAFYVLGASGWAMGMVVNAKR